MSSLRVLFYILFLPLWLERMDQTLHQTVAHVSNLFCCLQLKVKMFWKTVIFPYHIQLFQTSQVELTVRLRWWPLKPTVFATWFFIGGYFLSLCWGDLSTSFSYWNFYDCVNLEFRVLFFLETSAAMPTTLKIYYSSREMRGP